VEGGRGAPPGDASPQNATSHGASIPRSLDGRFGKLFPKLPVRDLGDAAMDALFAILDARSREFPRFNSAIPAGYTYLGQFVDHDLTFDATSQLRRANDLPGLPNLRTPRLDLDSVYGAGPTDQPYLYEWLGPPRDRGVKLLVGHSPGDGDTPIEDLPRNEQGRALIGDPRNDENLIVAQLHLLFLRFHNAVVDHVRERDGLEGRELFEQARRVVRWQYQWLVVHDFLRKVAGKQMAERVLGSVTGGAARTVFDAGQEPFMPFEFSAAAYRFGHSMVRPSYQMNTHPGGDGPILRQPHGGEHLGGLRRLPPRFVIDWRLFVKLSSSPTHQDSMSIDPRISRRLFELPVGISVEGITQLPRLNLLRARTLRLPAGPDVAGALGQRPLDAGQLGLTGIASDAVRDELLQAAPLWYYVLCEAEAPDPGPGGSHLGEVGGQIVAGVLVALLAADPESYLRQPGWIPDLLDRPGDFTLAQLVRFAYPQYRSG
jgi:hypothetical protein